jgi:O-antigen/teichoic acid export membrane protein
MDLFFFKKYSVRSKVVFKNFIISGFVRLAGIILSFATLPITLKYLSSDEYGVWLTIYSMMAWLTYFDGGLGSGLRNRIGEAMSMNDISKVQSYISTSYFILLCTIAILIPCFYLFNLWFDWASFLDVSDKHSNGFNSVILIIFVLFCLQFVFKLIDNILIADQKSGEADLLNIVGSASSLLCFYLLSSRFQGSLLLVGTIFIGIPFLISLGYSSFLFLTRYREVRPTLRFVNLSYYKDLMTLGSKFFIIQMTSLVTLGFTNVLILKTLGSGDVVVYNIAYKYFNITVLFFSILTNSLYGSLNESYFKGDIDWIKGVIKNAKLLSILIILAIAVMVVSSNVVYNLWIGSSIQVPWSVSILMGLYFAIIIWVSVYATFISSVGKVKLASYVSIINALIYFPLAIGLSNYFGIQGLIIAQILLIISGLYWLPVQYRKLINRNAEGVWNT